MKRSMRSILCLLEFERQIQYEVPLCRVGFPKYDLNIQKTWDIGHTKLYSIQFRAFESVVRVGKR